MIIVPEQQRKEIAPIQRHDSQRVRDSIEKDDGG